MELTFAPKNHLQIDEAFIPFSNFAGRGDEYNREGDRNFAITIPTQEMADALTDAGWNVTIRQPKNPGDEPFMFLKVKLRFDVYPPIIYLNSNGNLRKLDENSVGLLDAIDFERVDMDIRAYNWTYGGRSGRTAYLEKLHVVQKVDRFAARYAPGVDSEDRLPI